MKKILFILCMLVAFSAKAQFPSVDSLENFINRYVRNSAVESFTNLRLNTALRGVLSFVASRGGAIDTVYALNDSAFRIVSYPDSFDVVIRGANVGNIATKGQRATGNYTHDWFGYQLRINRIGDLGLFSTKPLTGTLYRQNGIGTQGNQGLQIESYQYDSSNSNVTDISKIGIGAQSVGVEGVSIQSTDIMGSGSILTVTKNDTARTEVSALLRAKAGVEIYAPDVSASSDKVLGWNESTKRLTSIDRTSLLSTINSVLGVIYQSVGFGSLTDFVNRGATAAVSGGNIEFSGGTNSFTQTLEYNKGTLLEQWHTSAVFIPKEKTSTSYGFGLGIRSTSSSAVNVSIKFDASTGAERGKLKIYAGSNTLVKTSTDSITFNANDSIDLHVERTVDSISTWVVNRTQNITSPKISYGYSFANGATVFNQNSGRFAIYSFGGAFNVSEFSITSITPKRPDILVIGDSKTAGYFANSPYDRWAVLLRKIFPNTVIQAGAADKLTDAMARLDETISILPKQVILCIGVNDIRAGVDSNTIKSNYSSYVASLQAEGIKVLHLLSMKETALNADWFNNYISRTWPAEFIDSKFQYCSDCLASDNIHLNNKGNKTVADAVINSGKLQGKTSAEDNSLNSVLAKGSVSNITPIIGSISRLGGTATGSFSDPKLILTSSVYPSIVMETGTTSFGGGSIVWKTNRGGPKVNPSLFGDSVAMAMVVHAYDNTARTWALFTATNTSNQVTGFAVRQAESDFIGTRSRVTAQAGQNLYAGYEMSGTNNFNSTQAVFAVNNANNQIDLYNLPSVGIDTTTYKPLVRRSDGRTYSSYWPKSIGSLNGLTDGVQTFAVPGTTGTDINWSSIAGVHTLNVPNASASARGVVTTGAQTFGGVKSFADRVVITKGAGITPDPNNLLYLGRNEPGNFYPLFVIEDKTDDGYAQFGYWGKNRKWNVGVGNGPSNFFGVQDKWYVLDATSNNVRLSIDTDGTVDIPERLKARGGVGTRIRTITASTTIDKYDHTVLIDANGGAVTVTLPTAASSYDDGYGITYVLKRIDGSGNTITIQAAGSDTIDGSPTAGLNISAKQTITIQSAGGTAWYIIKN